MRPKWTPPELDSVGKLFFVLILECTCFPFWELNSPKTVSFSSYFLVACRFVEGKALISLSDHRCLLSRRNHLNSFCFHFFLRHFLVQHDAEIRNNERGFHAQQLFHQSSAHCQFAAQLQCGRVPGQNAHARRHYPQKQGRSSFVRNWNNTSAIARAFGKAWTVSATTNSSRIPTLSILPLDSATAAVGKTWGALLRTARIYCGSFTRRLSAWAWSTATRIHRRPSASSCRVESTVRRRRHPRAFCETAAANPQCGCPPQGFVVLGSLLASCWQGWLIR